MLTQVHRMDMQVEKILHDLDIDFERSFLEYADEVLYKFQYHKDYGSYRRWIISISAYRGLTIINDTVGIRYCWGHRIPTLIELERRITE